MLDTTICCDFDLLNVGYILWRNANAMKRYLTLIKKQSSNPKIMGVILGLLLCSALTSFADIDKWTKKADMPTARHYFSTSTVNNKIYAIGGAKANSPLSTVEEYDPSTDTWTKKADMPTARWALSTSAVNGKIYAIGGFRGGVISTVEEYNPITDTWTKKSDMPTKRAWLTASVVNGKIYAIGGEDRDSNALSIVEEYDPVTDIWSRKADMPTAREPSSVALNGKIYVIGGIIVLQNSSTCLSTVEEYDPVSNIWTVKAEMPTKRAHLATSAAGERIYAIGGLSWFPMVTHTTVEEYDPVADEWTKKTDMLTARWGLSASVVNDRIYAIGGADNNNIELSVSEEYDTGYASKLVGPKEKLAISWGELKTK